MRICFHRGSREIGGNCVEVASGDARILLDLGRPLWAGADEAVPLPPVSGLASPEEPPLLGLFLSHPHLDHYGLARDLGPHVPVYIGEAASRILREAAFFEASGADFAPRGFLRHREPIGVGPFRVTPYLVDHSAFDAYALLVEADGRRLLYSGDLRDHGRKARLFRELCRRPPPDTDVLLLEGTQVRRFASPARLPTERAVEADLVKAFRKAPGLVLVAFSAQNIDRLVTVYRAARRAERELVVDLYAACVAKATGNASIPQIGFPGFRVWVPRSQRVRVKEAGAFERVDRLGDARIYPEGLVVGAERRVLLLRGSMLRELEQAGCLSRATAIWSQWEGYLREPSSGGLLATVERLGIPLRVLHTSGHAATDALQVLVRAVRPGRLVPMHTEAPEGFAPLFERVEIHEDGQWWDV